MEEILEFKDGIERLEYLVGANVEEIVNVLDKISIPSSKEIIELRFGLRDGKEYTLFEVADILKEKDKNKSVIETYLDNLKQYGIKNLFEEWNAEAVRKSEATTIRILKTIFESM